MKCLTRLALVLTPWIWLPTASIAEDFKIPEIEAFLLPPAIEIALARSAAPEEVSSAATVLVLSKDGYEAIEPGSNGVVCFVVRSWGRPEYREDNASNYRPAYLVPECLDRYAALTILPLQQFRTRLAIRRTSAPVMNALTRKAFTEGQLQRTTTASISYMLSRQMQFNKGSPGTPHIMVYLPDHYSNQTIGVVSQRGDGFFIEGGPQHPYTAAVIYRGEYGVNSGVDPDSIP